VSRNCSSIISLPIQNLRMTSIRRKTDAMVFEHYFLIIVCAYTHCILRPEY